MAASQVISVLIASTGSYEDYRQEIVAVSHDEEKLNLVADKHKADIQNTNETYIKLTAYRADFEKEFSRPRADDGPSRFGSSNYWIRVAEWNEQVWKPAFIKWVQQHGLDPKGIPLHYWNALEIPEYDIHQVPLI